MGIFTVGIYSDCAHVAGSSVAIDVETSYLIEVQNFTCPAGVSRQQE